MKKVYFLLVSVLILGLVFAGCGGITNITAPSTSQDEIVYLTKEGTLADPISFPLYAGQHDLVGEVLVWDENEELCVKYRLFDGTGDDPEDVVADGWGITETHLAVGHEEGDIPQTKKGNPIPGEFLYGDDELEGVDSWQEECIPFDELGKEEPGDLDPIECGNTLVIAAHAVVEREVCVEIAPAGVDYYISDENTDVLDGGILDKSTYPHSAVEAYDPANWDGSISHEWHNLGGIPMWIWESNPVVNPVAGDKVVFERKFNIPGIPNDEGSLWIACDNGFAVELNGVFLESYNLPQYPTLGDFTEAYVLSSGWQTAQWIPFNSEDLIQGENTLRIIAVNEQMDGGTVNSNPGGLKFTFCAHWDDYYECTTESETAWGAVEQGEIRFVDKGNWATYFEYTTNECEE